MNDWMGPQFGYPPSLAGETLKVRFPGHWDTLLVPGRNVEHHTEGLCCLIVRSTDLKTWRVRTLEGHTCWITHEDIFAIEIGQAKLI